MKSLELNKNTGGFSLLELVLAVAIFSLGAIALITLLIDSNISTRLSVEKTKSLFYAREGINAVRSIRDNNWSDLVDGSYGLLSSDSSWTFDGTSDLLEDNKYERIVTITASSTAPAVKDISVTVVWNLSPSRIATTSLQTILTNWNL